MPEVNKDTSIVEVERSEGEVLPADALFQFPDAQRRKQQTFCAAKRADRGKFLHLFIGRDDALTGTTASSFGTAGVACCLAQREVSVIVHNY